MATGYKTQLTKQIGEHLVVSKLGRLGIIATPFAGNVPDFDILASDLSGNTIPIQVKTINGPSWQFNVTNFLNIEINEKEQVILGKVKLKYPELICVFVFLKEDENDEFYILELKDIQNHFKKEYKERKKPKNVKSTHCAIWPKEIKKYRNNWGLITGKFDIID